MDVQKRPLLHLLNILMACLGVVAGGLVICQLLLTLAAPSLQSAGGADLPEEEEISLQNVPTVTGVENEEQALLKSYEQEIKSGTATAEIYLCLADLWVSCGEEERASQVLRQGMEQLQDSAELKEKLVQLTGQPEEAAEQVKMLRRDTYDTGGNLAWSLVYQYDEQGRMSGVTSYDAAGIQTGYVEVLYNAAGQEIQSYSYCLDDGTLDPVVYSYDAAGRMEREENYFHGALDCYFIDQYNEMDQVVRSDGYYSDGELIGYTLYTYDDDGNKTQGNTYTSRGELETRSEWIYDSTGRNIEYIDYGTDGTEYYRMVFTYNEEGNVIQEETWAGETRTVTYIQYG